MPESFSAIHAPNARARAKIAADYIRRGRNSTRNFSSCFEMGDGDEVLRILWDEMVPRSPKLASNIGRYLHRPTNS